MGWKSTCLSDRPADHQRANKYMSLNLQHNGLHIISRNFYKWEYKQEEED